MDETGQSKSSGWGGAGLLAIVVLLAFGAWQAGLFARFANSTETVDQTWFATYTDRYLSTPTSVTVIGSANLRDFPTAQGTRVVDRYTAGTRVSGRWVRGADPKILWFRVADQRYLWQGNLQGDAAVMAKASQAAADPHPSESATLVAAPQPSVPAPPAPAPPAASSPATAAPPPAEAFDAAVVAALVRTVASPGLVSEIVENADIVSPPEQLGATRLVWSMCAVRCAYDYSSAVILTGSDRLPLVQVCIHDGRRMADWSEWYETSQPVTQRSGLCPSKLAAVK